MTQKMENETNFRRAKMNITPAITKDYENDSPADPANKNPDPRPLTPDP